MIRFGAPYSVLNKAWAVAFLFSIIILNTDPVSVSCQQLSQIKLSDATTTNEGSMSDETRGLLH